MKIRNLKLIIALVSVTVAITSCKKYLDTKPVGQYLAVNYYKNPSEAYAGLVACYSPLNSGEGGILLALNAGSDDCYAGGGSSTDNPVAQAFSNFNLMNAANSIGSTFWNPLYAGIYNCNVSLSQLPTVPGMTADSLKRYTAESKFLRAYYYFDLVRTFKNVPLILKPLTSSEVYDQPQAAPEAVYAQIESDLNAAIADLPVKIPATQNGRVTQGAAKALLGKVFLFEKKWTQAADMLAQVNGTPGGSNSYGYKLQANFASLFDQTNKFNSESIFEIQQSNTISGWANWYSRYIGPRSSSLPVIFSGGYGFEVVTLNLVNAIKNDPRYPATVINADSIAKATNTSYSPGYQNTGYFTRKYAPMAATFNSYGEGYDYIIIRLADTYLMEAEALVQAGTNTTRAQALLDAVRARIKLVSIPATLTNIYTERRLELAQEGHRWYDLVRTGQAPTVLAFKNFTAGKNEILPIPLGDLNNTKLKQNPGY
ncbi:RagB/SusD family nutrient uptake outer membrane protein [Mucilaginibacter sp. PAMB04168]|uniref:RagB/SusD family nutrient uptake outer membrane protein n=1 Tax=Mucilaginibacter sp. PAMB04168 TaxID=3138567 RepID=UPI0031F6BFE6